MTHKHVRLALALMILIITSGLPVSSTGDINFSLNLLYPSDNNTLETVAQALTSSWADIFVDVQKKAVTNSIYNSKLLFSENEWDVALVQYDNINEHNPALFSLYGESSTSGQSLYDYSSSQLDFVKINSLDTFIDLVNNYQNAEDVATAVQVTQQAQALFNDELLLDIPIVSKPIVMISRLEYDGLDIQEGVLRSAFLGSHWNSNPEVRQGKQETDKIAIPVYDVFTLPDPLYYQTRSEREILDALYPSLFIMDKSGAFHPNLVRGLKQKNDGQGTTWELQLQSDALWSDNEVVNVWDVKFTLDMITFPWVQAQRYNDFRTLDSINVIDNTTLTLHFNTSSISQKQALSNLYILPEHVFNTSFTTTDGTSHLPYESGYPMDSNDWNERIDSAVTAGPYQLSLFKNNEFVKIVSNPDYWFPRTGTGFDEAYYFNFNGSNAVTELPIRDISFHFSNRLLIDQNTVNLMFDSGERDFIELRQLEKLSKYSDSTLYQQNILERGNSGIKVVFSPSTSYLKPYAIRDALAHLIDREIISGVFGRGFDKMDTIVSHNFANYYNPEVALTYNYNYSRDIFINQGYFAREVLSDEANTPLGISFLLALLAIPVMRRKK